MKSLAKALFLLVLFCDQYLVHADIGILSFWVPELYTLLGEIEKEGNEIETYIFGARKFYVTQYRGHNVVVANTGVGISNTAATTATLLQKFPSVDRIIGSGIAGGIDPSLRVGDVVIPDKWSLYQKQHFAKELEDGSHEIPGFQLPVLMGDDCGNGFGPDAPLCEPGVNTWNYMFIYPASVPGADPTAEGIDATSEGSVNYWWFNVDEEMLETATTTASRVVLAKEAGDAVLDYDPVVTTGGSGVSGPTFLDNVDYREYAFNAFGAVAVDMESASAAHVCTQMGKKFLFIRSLSDLAGADQDGNVMGVFFSIAAQNAVTFLTAFLEDLPVNNESPDLPVPNDFSPGEDTPGLLGLLSFWQPELEALKSIMNDGEPEELVYGGRKFYRGKVGNADVVAVLTGIGISNTGMTTALMLQLFPGIERITGGGIAGGIDPALRVGDVTIPQYWMLYQMQIYAKDMIDHYEPPIFEVDIIVGKECGGFDGVDTYLTGDGPCDYKTEASNFGFIFPKTVQTPDPNEEDELLQISEGPTRSWFFEVDSEMYDIAQSIIDDVELKNQAGDTVLDYTPQVVTGGYGVSGPTFVDNVAYREYSFDNFEARSVDMETASAAHIAFQNGIPFLFFRSLSDLAGADQDGNVMGVFFSVAAENTFTVTSKFIEALYPDKETNPPKSIFLILSVPILTGYSFFLRLQSYVLQLDVVINSIGITFTSFELLLELFAFMIMYGILPL